jgi:hypothetical protein
MKEWYWVGVLRDGVYGPPPKPRAEPQGAHPLPLEWLGLETLDEAMRFTHMLLSDPAAARVRVRHTWPGLLEQGKVAYLRGDYRKGVRG